MAMPPSDIMFMVISNTCMMRKTEMIQMGMDTEMTAVAPRSRRKTNSTMAASSTPKTMFWTTESTVMLIMSLWSMSSDQSNVGWSAVTSFSASLARSATCKVLVSDCLLTEIVIQGSPPILAMAVCSLGAM